MDWSVARQFSVTFRNWNFPGNDAIDFDGYFLQNRPQDPARLY
jgi:hypothetical protein